MPGVLKKSQDDLGHMKPSKRGPTEEMADHPSKKVKRESLMNGVQLVNGDHGLSNGVQTNGLSPARPEAHSTPAAAQRNVAGDQLPEEILHIAANHFHPLSTVIKRLAQETFNEVVDVIGDLSEIEVSSANGFSNHERENPQTDSKPPPPPAPDDPNANKKQRILDFAQERRTLFIKMLVISQWLRREEGIGKAIDIGFWLKTEAFQLTECAGWMKAITHALWATKVPHPDLKTALETLSLGKASWLTDLNYLPLEKIPPRELLKTLRRINTLLSIRLNIYETIPPHFRDFEIASGRATFKVKDEFEVDLAIADEDPKSQLYFLDFRFLFSPAKSNLLSGNLRNDLESKLNDILKREGLSGCYNFLHDFVLTHKLSILRTQAYEMLRGHWSDQLKVEVIHRTLVVQYWSQRPGSKNWAEIGIKRGKGKQPNGLDPGLRIPEIALRWFRGGKEVSDFDIDLNLGDVSLAGILGRIISMHTTYIFKETLRKLKNEALYSERLLKLEQSFSATEPISNSLLIQLTKSKEIKLVQEPITGQIAILPANPLNSSAERELNILRSPAEEVSARIATLRCITAREELEVCARSASWEVLRSLNLDRETTQRYFPRDTIRIAFLRRKEWEPHWNLAITTSLMGDAVWVVETGEREATNQILNNSVTPGQTLKLAFKISKSGLRALLLEPTISNLKQIESTAVGMIAQHLDTQQLVQKGIPHKCQPDASALQMRSASLRMKFASQQGADVLRNPSPMALAWRNDVILLEFAGLDRTTSSGNHVVKARLKKGIPNINELTSALSSFTTFHPSSGVFAFRLTTPVGRSTIPNLIHRLATIERLIEFLTIIKRHQRPCTILSLTRLSFSYDADSSMKATIDFAPNNPMQISFDPSSPLLRIQDALLEMLRSPTGGLTEVLAHIDITLNLLRGLSAIESSWAGLSDRVDILPRSAECFVLRYHNPPGKVEINLNDRKGVLMWMVNERGAPKDESARDEALAKSLKDLARGNGDDWRGVNGGIIATPTGVEHLISKLDEIFKSTRKDAVITDNGANYTASQGLTNGTTITQTTEEPHDEAEAAAPTPNPRKRKPENTGDNIVVLD